MTSLAQEVTPAPAPWTFMDVLQSLGNTWLWESISMTGGYGWLHEAITDSSHLAVMDGLYIHMLYPNLCSGAFVLECTTNDKQQEYWILAIQAAREVCRLCATTQDTSQCCGSGTTER